MNIKRFNFIGFMLLFFVIGFILAFMIIRTGQQYQYNNPNLVKTGTDYIELVDNVCYRSINENTEDIFNITYRNGWGGAYRQCILYNLNVDYTEFDCVHWRCSKQDNDYRMDSTDFNKCEQYFRTSDYKFKAVCGDD